MGFAVQLIRLGKTGRAPTERSSEQSVPLSLRKDRAEWGSEEGWRGAAGRALGRGGA